jgi:hypothetical protein
VGIGSQVTITGSDLTGTIEDGFYDFTINHSSQYSETMMSAGADGISYVFSTQYKDEWPGYVEYSIDTTFTTGTVVNVYQYDNENEEFTTVAKNVTVSGGNVTFIYDEGGDFLITTATIDNAVGSDSIAKTNRNNRRQHVLCVPDWRRHSLYGFGLQHRSARNEAIPQKKTEKENEGGSRCGTDRGFRNTIRRNSENR